MEAMSLDPAIGLLIMACIALLFASAAAHKLRDLATFNEIFSAYGLAPIISRARMAWLVPMLEIADAAGLAVKFSRPYAAALGMLLLLGYAAAIAINLKRGHRDLACGCGGPERRPIAAWMVWRNALLALAAGVAFVPGPTGLWESLMPSPLRSGRSPSHSYICASISCSATRSAPPRCGVPDDAF